MASTATTPTTTSTTVLGLAVDRGYVDTLLGKITISAFVLNIICFICVVCQGWYIPPQGWFYFVCGTGFWFCLFEILIALCGVQGRIQVVPWKLGYLIIHGLWCFFYLTAASAVTHYAANYADRQGWWACTVFGFIACIVYGYSFFIRLQDWRGVTVTTTSPA